jgi:hypothetical protein
MVLSIILRASLKISGLVLVLGYFIFNAVQIELIGDEILVNFAEKYMIVQTAEPLDPPWLQVFTEL